MLFVTFAAAERAGCVCRAVKEWDAGESGKPLSRECPLENPEWNLDREGGILSRDNTRWISNTKVR